MKWGTRIERTSDGFRHVPNTEQQELGMSDERYAELLRDRELEAIYREFDWIYGGAAGHLL